MPGAVGCPHLVLSPLGPRGHHVFSPVLKGPPEASLSHLQDGSQYLPTRLERHLDRWTEGPAPGLGGTQFHPSLPASLPWSRSPTLNLVAASSTLEGGHSSPHSAAGSIPSGGGSVHKPLSISVVFSHLCSEDLYCLCAPGPPSSFSPWGLCVSQQVGLGLLPCPSYFSPALLALLASPKSSPPHHSLSVPGSPERGREESSRNPKSWRM